MKELKNITPLEENFGRWYTDVVTQGQLIEYGNSKGSMIFKPISWGIWENIQKEMNKILKNKSVKNVYLPTLIPLSYIEKEKEHVKGFAPELATITKVGDKELSEPFVLRPTSEVLFGELFSKITNSHKDLPIKYNQWANVFRWEKTTNPFLRTREFLWQEGHTIHSNAVEARKMTREILRTYAKFCKNFLAIPVIMGKKTPKEKFAGAISTYTIEAMMKDGKALQAGTSHYLGQNFAKAFNIQFKNRNNKLEYGYQTSWGVSTRLIGAIIMTHGDNRGIIIPPNIATYQIDILELFGKRSEEVRNLVNRLEKELGRKYSVRVDRTDKGPGFKAGKSEIEGTPLRIEIGPRDLEQGFVTLVKRNTLEKIQVKVQDIKIQVKGLLKVIQEELYVSAKERLDTNIVEVNTYDELKEQIKNNKFVIAPFAGGDKEEELIKKETLASTRCIPFDFVKKGSQKCIITSKETNRFVIFAKAY